MTAWPASTTPLVDPLPELDEDDRPPVVLYRPDTPPTDGRAARSYRTTEKIVHAMLELLEDDRDLRPTADLVAGRAGVSRRALYLHFENLEEVFARAAERRTSELFAEWAPPAGSAPLDVRIRGFASSWARLLEALMPVCQASLQHEPASPTVARTMDSVRAWMRAATETAFRHELSSCPPGERPALAAALHYLTSWGAWADLRRQGADAEQATLALHRLLRSLLSP